MNIIDVVCLLIIISMTVWGLLRGLIREIFSLGGIILGVILGLSLNGEFGRFFTTLFGVTEDIGQIIAFVIIFLLVAIIVTWIGIVLSKAIRLVLLGWLDRLGGLIFGFCKGVLISSVVCFLLLALPIPNVETSVEGSKVGPLVIGVAPATYNNFFGGGELDLRGMIRNYLDEGKPTEEEVKPEVEKQGNKNKPAVRTGKANK